MFPHPSTDSDVKLMQRLDLLERTARDRLAASAIGIDSRESLRSREHGLAARGIAWPDEASDRKLALALQEAKRRRRMMRMFALRRRPAESRPTVAAAFQNALGAALIRAGAWLQGADHPLAGSDPVVAPVRR